MKYIQTLCFVLGGFLAQNGITQAVIPHNIPCLDITPENISSLESGLQANDCIRADGETVDFNTNQNYSIRAGQYITFNDNTIITPDSTHSFHAYIQKEDMDLAWYHPNDIAGTIGRYEKLEIGVHFNDSSLNAKINNFVRDEAGDKLNPFNPEEIDLYANFWILSTLPDSSEAWFGPKRVNGFYYEEFARGVGMWDTLTNEDNFRIRYAPPVYGMWRCQISAVVAGYDTMHVSDFTFECVGSPNKGFVNVGDNKRYLKVGDEPFFPVGQNLTGPNDSIHQAEYKDHPVIAADYVGFHSNMTELADNGANYFRYIVSPWQTEIEFEHLGNYSNRMTNAWEFDKILDTAKALDLKIHYDMQMHYAFEVPNGFTMTFWDWSAKGDPLNPHYPEDALCFRDNDSGYCYRNELDMVDPLDFLTNSTAMSYYKKRLRYMIARWGYSTEIAVMELLSEANNFGGEALLRSDGGGCPVQNEEDDITGITTDPYHDEPASIIPDLLSWQIEMCRYIKEDLGHTEHPLAIDYAGGPNIPAGDLIYYSDYVDIANFNYYGLAVNKAEILYNTIKSYRGNALDPSLNLEKPMMNPEYGTNEETWECDHNSGYIHRTCLTPFTGLAGSAMSWDNHWNETDTWKYLGPVADFMKGIPLDADNYVPLEPIIQDDYSVEVLYLRKIPVSNRSKIIGVISNRTFNYFTAGDSVDGCAIHDPDAEYEEATDFWSSDLDDIKFPNMGSNKSYRADFYNALTGDFTGSVIQSSNVLGNFKLHFPTLLTGDSLSPILFFKLYRADGSFSPLTESNEYETRMAQKFKKDSLIDEIALTNWEVSSETEKILVSPNPTNGIVNISISNIEDGMMNWTLTDAKGNLIKKNKVMSTNFSIDLSVYTNGMYYLTFETPDTETNRSNKVFKILKQ